MTSSPADTAMSTRRMRSIPATTGPGSPIKGVMPSWERTTTQAGGASWDDGGAADTGGGDWGGGGGDWGGGGGDWGGGDWGGGGGGDW